MLIIAPLHFLITFPPAQPAHLHNECNFCIISVRVVNSVVKTNQAWLRDPQSAIPSQTAAVENSRKENVQLGFNGNIEKINKQVNN